ncbi:hypothetical protein Pmani_039006 [Petrolisthes manimaculis]|uniref:Uncharacterized protein n=1 Tax=Petrolisthes manimaculis TaxID=1843537 RepID=A0AAE1NEZ8_9EUCA|nr:hypothetical protein Pmani_039006 [Petrolisthes manimaculis]
MKAGEVGLPKSPETPSSTSGGSSRSEGPSLSKLTPTRGHYRRPTRGPTGEKRHVKTSASVASLPDTCT